MNERQLLQLKKDIDAAERESAELAGQRKYVIDQMKTTYGVSSIEEAEAELESIESELAAKQKKLDAAIEKVEEQYNAAQQ